MGVSAVLLPQPVQRGVHGMGGIGVEETNKVASRGAVPVTIRGLSRHGEGQNRYL